MLKEIKMAMIEKLNRMYEWSFHEGYSLSGKTKLNDESNLNSFRSIVLDTIQFIIKNDCKHIEQNIKILIEFTHECGKEYGLIWDRFEDGKFVEISTGGWGVRWSDSLELLTMFNYELPIGLNFPEYNKPSYTFRTNYGDDDTILVDLTEIRFSEYMVIFDFRPKLFTEKNEYCSMRGWSDTVNFSGLRRDGTNLPFFMKHYEKVS